jgi:hypothetical protein
MVLSDGKVAYHGVPEKAYEVFVNALQSTFLSQGVDIPPVEDHNPADVIMDMLGDRKMRKIVNSYYDDSGEPTLVRKAVAEAYSKEQDYNEQVDSSGNALLTRWRMIFQGNRLAGRTQNHSIERLAALEARAMKRASLSTLLYLPIIFFGYGFLLGTVYFQTTGPFLIMSGFCVYSVASALFMFPALYTFYTRALEIYAFEHADGSGRATDLVIQPFVRFISMAFVPVIFCAGVLYFLLVDVRRWNLVEFLQIALVNISLNQVWTALLIWLILTFPQKAFRLSPVLSALAGFTSGFFIPIQQIPWWYRWLSFINPNYYGFSASAVILLSDFESDCERDGGSELECYPVSGRYILENFAFNVVNPYQNIVILLGMTVFFLVMAALSNWVRYLSLQTVKKRVTLILKKTVIWNPETVTDLPQLHEEKQTNDETEMLTSDEDSVCSPSEPEPSKGKMAWMRIVERYKESKAEMNPDTQETRPMPDTMLRSTSKTRSIKAKSDKRKASISTVVRSTLYGHQNVQVKHPLDLPMLLWK